MRIAFFFFFAVVLSLAILAHFGSENIPEPDSMYHFRHAALYREIGIFSADFPWIPFSAIYEFSGDIWYGFHIFLLPFTFFEDQIFGLKTAGVFITFVFLILFYWSLARLKIAWKFLWPFLMFFSSPYILYHLAMARPHVLSLGLVALIFSFFLTEAFWGIFFASILLAFIHPNIFWVPVLACAIFSAARFFTERIFDSRSFVAMVSGLFLGFFLRPNPFGAAKILYVQVFQLFLEKQKGTPLNFGIELFPARFLDLGPFLCFIILWLFAAFLFFRGFDRLLLIRKNWILGSGLISLVFFLMTIFLAQRSFDYWILFGVFFVFFVFSNLVSKKWRYESFIALCAILIFMLFYAVYKHGKLLSDFGWNPYRFKQASEWTHDNSKNGEIVFNASWDQFPQLFFWNAKNYYISGMDPIFQYYFSPELYWKSYYLETGKTSKYTCAKTSCEEVELEETYNVLRNDFSASYVFVAKPEDSELYSYMKNDTRFFLGFEDENSAVFKIK